MFAQLVAFDTQPEVVLRTLRLVTEPEARLGKLLLVWKVVPLMLYSKLPFPVTLKVTLPVLEHSVGCTAQTVN